MTSISIPDTFLQINDQINTVLNRYQSFKDGDYVAASNPIPAELSSGAGSSSRAQNDLSLIDFDDSAPSNATAGGSSINELESLFGPSSTLPQQTQPAQPTFPFQTNPQQSFVPPAQFQSNIPFQSGSLFSNTAASVPTSTNTPPPNLNFATHPTIGVPPVSTSPQLNGSIRLPGTPQVRPQQGVRMGSPAPNYFSTPTSTGPTAPSAGSGMGYGMNGGMGGIGLSGASIAPQQVYHPQQAQLHQTVLSQQRPIQLQQQHQQQPLQPQSQQQANSSNASGQAQGKDPFADLVGLF